MSWRCAFWPRSVAQQCLILDGQMYSISQIQTSAGVQPIVLFRLAQRKDEGFRVCCLQAAFDSVATMAVYEPGRASMRMAQRAGASDAGRYETECSDVCRLLTTWRVRCGGARGRSR